MFWLFCAFVAAHGLSLVEASRGHSLDAVCRLVNAVALVVVIAQALGTQASVVAVCELSSCASRAPECWLSSCGARA